MNNPVLNIETVGCKATDGVGNNFACKYFLASLEFNQRFLFSNINVQYYLPIRFKSEAEIKNVFKYYDNLYFQVIVYNTLRADRKTKEYHISEYKNIAKLLFKEDFKTNSLDAHGFTIDFKIKYKNANILIINYTHKFDTDFLYKLAKNISVKDKFLKFFKEHYSVFPTIYKYTANIEGYNSVDFRTIESAIKYIDNEIDKENKLNNEIESYYSLKSFKLVENF